MISSFFKNKSFISFIINILVGIIFTLPVYSFSENLFDFSKESEKYIYSDSDKSNNIRSLIDKNSFDFISESKFSSIPPFHLRNIISQYHKDYKNYLSEFRFIENPLKNRLKSFSGNLSFTEDFFICITFLNSLGTIKLLC